MVCASNRTAGDYRRVSAFGSVLVDIGVPSLLAFVGSHNHSSRESAESASPGRVLRQTQQASVSGQICMGRHGFVQT